MTTLRFRCGDRFYQVAPDYAGQGFIGVCAGGSSPRHLIKLV